MKVLLPFRYLDPYGKLWTVPPDTIVDGASIPRALWSVAGAPYSGPYRDASVIHDYYCETKERDWKEVHQALYYGMRAKGVGYAQAQMMYAAVYAFGPRWIVEPRDGGKPGTIAGKPKYDEKTQERLEGFAGGAARTPTEIEEFADALLRVDGSDAVETLLKTRKDCSPVLTTARGGGNFYILCELDEKAKKLNATRNLRILINDVSWVTRYQTRTMIPAVHEYRKSPTADNWRLAGQEMVRTRELVKIAILSALDYDASRLSPAAENVLSEVFQSLTSRVGMLDKLALGPPTKLTELDTWLKQYDQLVDSLLFQLVSLRRLLENRH